MGAGDPRFLLYVVPLLRDDFLVNTQIEKD